MRRNTHSTDSPGYETESTCWTPNRDGSLLVTFALVAAFPAGMLALAFPAVVAGLGIGIAVGVATG